MWLIRIFMLAFLLVSNREKTRKYKTEQKYSSMRLTGEIPSKRRSILRITSERSD